MIREEKKRREKTRRAWFRSCAHVLVASCNNAARLGGRTRRDEGWWVKKENCEGKEDKATTCLVGERGREKMWK
jgi:hypothetical protein